jgi:hypothetical protein
MGGETQVLLRSLQLPTEVLARVFEDVLVDPLLAHHEVVTFRHYLRHTLWGTDYAGHEVRREPWDLHVVDVDH